jgi:tRNA modification GTPase
VEREGIRRAREAVEASDLLVCLVDASKPLSEEEVAFLSGRDPATTLCLANKADLGDGSAGFRVGGHVFYSVSLVDPEAREPVVGMILRKAGLETDGEVSSPIQMAAGASSESGEVAVSARHGKALREALEELHKAEGRLETGREEDWLPAAMGLREAAVRMAAILGRQWDEDTLDAVFSRFCVGK